MVLGRYAGMMLAVMERFRQMWARAIFIRYSAKPLCRGRLDSSCFECGLTNQHVDTPRQKSPAARQICMWLGRLGLSMSKVPGIGCGKLIGPHMHVLHTVVLFCRFLPSICIS